jgi:tripartite ATP-independent transporter DctP family solute receptor
MKFSDCLRSNALKSICLAFIFLIVSSGTVLAAVTIKIGWTTSDGEKDPYAITAREFSAALQELSPGTFDVKYFPNRQLGDEKEMVEGLSFGTLDAAVITNAVIANVEPSFQLNDMPFLYGDEAQAHRVLDGPVGQKIMQKLLAKNIIGLGFAEGGFRHMINNVRPVYDPSDVFKVKYRVMQNQVFIQMFSSLGGNAVPMAWGEAFTAMQQGAIDGLEIPLAVIYSNKYFEVAKYLSLTKHTYSALGFLFSKRSLEKLSDENQEIVRKAARLAIDRQRVKSAKNSEEIIELLKAEGMQVNSINNPKEFRSLVTEIYDEFRGKIGEDLVEQALAEVQ